MKKSTALLLFISLTFYGYSESLFQQLCAFNPNWKQYESHIPNVANKNFTSDREYIQEHLKHVLNVLRTNPTDHLSEEQLNSRMQLIGVLSEYRLVGRFPLNYYRQERIPVFIDEHDTHCAVGHLLQVTGHNDIALRIARTNNYIWVKDIADLEVLDWQKKSGFTLEELKLIQGAYDFYHPDAFFLPNRHEIPQKPEVKLVVFEGTRNKRVKDSKNLPWLHGEGKNGVLHGKWVQNYDSETPWIVGYYDQGKRTGQWKEYYMGTDILCRTENWRNDQLNGVRKRWDREGNLIEEIRFKNGMAVLKTNYDLKDSLKYIRTPLDSSRVSTEIYDLGGGLLASGVESIYNPGNLLWFQNIELTALNSASITSRELSIGGQSSLGRLVGLNSANNFYQPSEINPQFGGFSPPLVKYQKQGEWTFYQRFNPENLPLVTYQLSDQINVGYPDFARVLHTNLEAFKEIQIEEEVGKITANFKDNRLLDLTLNTRSIARYLDLIYSDEPVRNNNRIHMPYALTSIGERTVTGEKIGSWYHYDQYGRLARKEEFILPFKEEAQLMD